MESAPQRYSLSKILEDERSAFIGDPVHFGDKTITVDKAGMTVAWVFAVEANPDPGFTWTHPAGGEIDYGALEKYEMDVDAAADKVKRESIAALIFNVDSPPIM